MSELQTKLLTDTWVAASWDKYLQVIEDPVYRKARGYYYKGHMRIEMSPVGHDHAADNSAIDLAINLFCITKGIPLRALTNCSYRKAGIQECQPDVSYYLGEHAQVIPWGTSIIDLNRYPAPDLVIEIAVTSLLDDQGAKRSLYEDLGVAEYWVVDVQKAQVLSFTIAEQGSKRIDRSQVLPGLAIPILEEAFHRSRQTDQSQVGAWLLTQFQ